MYPVRQSQPQEQWVPVQDLSMGLPLPPPPPHCHGEKRAHEAFTMWSVAPETVNITSLPTASGRSIWEGPCGMAQWAASQLAPLACLTCPNEQPLNTAPGCGVGVMKLEEINNWFGGEPRGGFASGLGHRSPPPAPAPCPLCHPCHAPTMPRPISERFQCRGRHEGQMPLAELASVRNEPPLCHPLPSTNVLPGEKWYPLQQIGRIRILLASELDVTVHQWLQQTASMIHFTSSSPAPSSIQHCKSSQCIFPVHYLVNWLEGGQREAWWGCITCFIVQDITGEERRMCSVGIIKNRRKVTSGVTRGTVSGICPSPLPVYFFLEGRHLVLLFLLAQLSLEWLLISIGSVKGSPYHHFLVS